MGGFGRETNATLLLPNPTLLEDSISSELDKQGHKFLVVNQTRPQARI